MNIKIRNRFNGNIIIAGEYGSIKDALEKNRTADLREATLCGADLREVDLREATLCGADLCGVDLREATLCGADLREADLRGADLREADLRGADLREADIYGAKGIKLPIINMNGSAHSFFYMDNIIKIGCEEHKVKHWMENYEIIGKDNRYSEDQIKEYFGYINMVYNLINKGE